MNLRLKRTPGLYVVGFMASGKSTIGRHLADKLGWSFFDIDDEIERAEQTSIASIFDTRGETEFRRIERVILSQHVRWIERGRPAVLALGGGAFAEEPNRELLLQNGLAIWLDCPLEVVKHRVAQTAHRPLARDAEKFEELYRARREYYAMADMRIMIVQAITSHPLLK
jgi:shikimate kinase